MSGEEFRAILRFNKIKFLTFAEYLGYRSNKTVKEVMDMKVIPYTFQLKLGEMLGLDLFDDKNLNLILKDIPLKYYEKQRKVKKVSLINDIFKL